MFDRVYRWWVAGFTLPGLVDRDGPELNLGGLHEPRHLHLQRLVPGWGAEHVHLLPHPANQPLLHDVRRDGGTAVARRRGPTNIRPVNVIIGDLGGAGFARLI